MIIWHTQYFIPHKLTNCWSVLSDNGIFQANTLFLDKISFTSQEEQTWIDSFPSSKDVVSVGVGKWTLTHHVPGCVIAIRVNRVEPSGILVKSLYGFQYFCAGM